MEDKLIKWIFTIAGSSYVMMVSLVIIFMSVKADDIWIDPFFIKTLILLCIYYFSLWLLYHGRLKSIKAQLKLWLSSLTFHLAIMFYVTSILESSTAFLILIPEIIILLLMLVGIYFIWKKQHEANI